MEIQNIGCEMTLAAGRDYTPAIPVVAAGKREGGLVNSSQAAIPAVSPVAGKRGAAGRTPSRAATPLLVLGDSTVSLLLHRVLALRALRGRTQLVVDCGGFLDPYLLARKAVRLGVRPALVLERVLVARAFTGYQEIRALLNLRRFGAGSMIYLLNPLYPLQDEDLPEGDRRWLFRRLLAGVDYFSRAGFPVRICQETRRSDPVFLKTLTRRLPVLLVSRGRIQNGSGPPPALKGL